MAQIESIWFHGADIDNSTMCVYAKMKRMGSRKLRIAIPEAFKRQLIDLAQTGVDHREEQLIASVLSEDLTIGQPKHAPIQHPAMEETKGGPA